ncbi:hypothetical protein A2943_02915 [Candidatus Adlerbacteria bacterium RIFCSPLOWO2_01_FULL_51_16]|uniref:Serine protease n=1 Tax=Candidatus Adlerbacteria bacterium RIFCSPLOWO2_01_FULL_51_16 TaxID=1797243 RepID=A0A1F4XGI1_9BACT|nr:MAG: hypothetical protein A2943_02915 [Candidatus Adlerbacteria bacterium RIFCSPLOWO2_01_FULL_51_16]
MDLERLTKHQIVLLTLLISFVTSIATGIVTVSLINQAPAGVTRTINQIVERTVEKVVPENLGAVVEKTVVVRDDDLAAESIATAQKAIVRITQRGGGEMVARGVIVDGKGVVLTDRAMLVAYGTENFDAILSSGERVRATLIDSSHSIAVVELRLGTSTVTPAPIAEQSKLKLGQSVIRIGGPGGDTVGVGVIASLSSSGMIEASVSSATPGSILINLFGEVIGITTGDSQVHGSDFYSVPDVSVLVSSPAP